MINCFELPKAVIIHCVSTVSLLFHLKCSFYTINKMCPGSNIVFWNSLHRREWHYSINHMAMQYIPKRLDRGIRSYLLQHNGYYIDHDDWFGWLSRCSLCTWWCSSIFFHQRIGVINALPGAIKQFILTPHKRQYPSF